MWPSPMFDSEPRKGKPLIRTFDRHATFALEDFNCVKRRLECRNLRAFVTDELDLELLLGRRGRLLVFSAVDT